MATREQLQDYPKTDKFFCGDVIGVPHPYCIGTKHVVHAADHFGGMLTADAIRDAEKRGAKCCICKGKLSYDEHQSAIVVVVDDARELKDIPELRDYLLSIKDRTEKDGFAGFAFMRLKDFKK